MLAEPTRTDVWDNHTPPEVHTRIRDEHGSYLAGTMQGLGHRTFGIGTFHTTPWDAPLGFDVPLHSEEFYATPEQRPGDAYAHWIATEHPTYDWVEALMGERTEMSYMPQMSPLPAELTVERWAADRAVEQLEVPRVARSMPGGEADVPFHGQVSFIGPHPPFAPPLPHHRMYDPDNVMIIFVANGGQSLLFDLDTDPEERSPLQAEHPEVVDQLQGLLVDELRREGITAALAGDGLAAFPYRVWPRRRAYQMDRSRGVAGFPTDPRRFLR